MIKRRKIIKNIEEYIIVHQEHSDLCAYDCPYWVEGGMDLICTRFHVDNTGVRCNDCLDKFGLGEKK
jgi:hypothetical protein